MEEIHNGIWLTADGISLKKVHDQLALGQHEIHTVINDSLSFNLDISESIKFYTLPLIFEWCLKSLVIPSYYRYDAPITEKCFNFVINKKQLNRYYLIKMIEWFHLSDFDYTYSGIGHDFNLRSEMCEIDDLSNQLGWRFKKLLLEPVSLPQKWLGQVDEITNYAMVGTNSEPGKSKNFLVPMISRTAVSLISESYPIHDRAAHLTEKTAYSLSARTFPIWVGGYGIADEMTRMGIDVFDDVIDHSYQYKSTLLERCYYAIASNLRILSDLDFATQQRQKHWHRLEQQAQDCSHIVKNFVDVELSKIEEEPRQILSMVRETLWL